MLLEYCVQFSFWITLQISRFELFALFQFGIKTEPINLKILGHTGKVICTPHDRDTWQNNTIHRKAEIRLSGFGIATPVFGQRKTVHVLNRRAPARSFRINVIIATMTVK
jgi:hypothetical protein